MNSRRGLRWSYRNCAWILLVFAIEGSVCKLGVVCAYPWGDSSVAFISIVGRGVWVYLWSDCSATFISIVDGCVYLWE